jgi:glycine cleavage system aminomethyltransferase T
MARRAGWEIPASYRPIDDERRAIAEGLAVADVSARGKLDCRGGVEPALASLVPPGAPPVGRVGVTAAEGPDRAMVARLAVDRALVLGGPGEALYAPHAAESTLEASAPAARSGTMLTDATSLLAGFALLGPRTFDLLARLTSFDLGELDPGTCAATRLADVTAQLVRSGEAPDAVEVYVGSEYGRFAWETLMAAGSPLGGQPVGWDALRAEGWW